MRWLRAAFLGLCCVAAGVQPNPVQAASPISGTVFVDSSGKPIFPLGANYEGPADRAWRMWEDDKFAPDLIGQDFSRAATANLALLRIFLQRPLANDIRLNRWAKLDRVMDLADQNGLRLVLTFGDYGESSVANLASIQTMVSAHYRGRPTIFSYDLRNEPHFFDLATAIYPPGVTARLQDPAIVAVLGETIARDQITSYRTSDEGAKSIPARLSDDQAWVYANALAAYRSFLGAASAWGQAHHSSSVAFLQTADAAPWADLLSGMNDTLAAWLKPQLDALRAADPGRPVTVGQVDPVIASLPVNAWLDYRTLHRYPAPSAAGIQSALALFADVRASVAGTPLVLGEFGFSNDVLDQQQSAALEADLVRGLRDTGGAAALKWMLNDDPDGLNAREDNFGLFSATGQPKAVVSAFKALGILRPVLPSVDAAAPPAKQPPSRTANPSSPPIAHDARYFPDARYRVDDDAIWSYFSSRGGVATFGLPVSRTFTLQGCSVQFFQRQVAQKCGARVGTINLLDPETFPYTRVNGSTFPEIDPSLKASAPAVSQPDYAPRMIAFVRSSAPDSFDGAAVSFGATFFNSIRVKTAGTDSAGILSLMDLEIWGAPISRPQRDPGNSKFIYQRFQRGIMHYDATSGLTQGLLLADYFKSILLDSADLPADLRSQAASSRYFRQYCPASADWICRPTELSGSNLTYAFEPG